MQLRKRLALNAGTGVDTSEEQDMFALRTINSQAALDAVDDGSLSFMNILSPVSSP